MSNNSNTVPGALRNLASTMTRLNRLTKNANNAATRAAANPTPTNVNTAGQAVNNVRRAQNAAQRAATQTVQAATTSVNNAARRAQNAARIAAGNPTPTNVRNANRANANLAQTANQGAQAVQVASQVTSTIN